ncbi:MAG: PhzF family phenazine biosynthesis protein [Candidatus Sumerlaeia bacterium]
MKLCQDPVTGSAHCVLGSYWSERLGKTRLTAKQLSSRGGLIECEAREDRILLMGRASLYLTGIIYV